MNNSGILIQARSFSERLPKKVYLPLTTKRNTTKSVIEWIYERLSKTQIPTFVIIPKEDSELKEYLQERRIPYEEGEHHNVRKRYIDIATRLGFFYIVRATADNPFVEPELVIPTLRALIDNQFDLFSFIGLPLGISIEAFTLNALKRRCPEYESEVYQEHVSLHIKKHPEIFRVHHENYKNFQQYYNENLMKLKDEERNWYQKHLPRLTLDQKEDYDVMKKIYSELEDDFSLYDVIDLYFKKKELFLGNMHVSQRRF
ncbi:MAG: hypothetical protein NZ853_05680 [Leptospiraceae bacterium]|nr:hypothetical protein [Leptospiraceae bacterium]MDW7976561.1 hypothetical protein [Leptospiraceae bacterium]